MWPLFYGSLRIRVSNMLLTIYLVYPEYPAFLLSGISMHCQGHH